MKINNKYDFATNKGEIWMIKHCRHGNGPVEQHELIELVIEK